MINMENVYIGDILLNKETNEKLLVVDTDYYQRDAEDYTKGFVSALYLKRYNDVIESLKLGNIIEVYGYKDYTILINEDDDFFDEPWEIIGREDIETSTYFRLRGAYND